ncbi:MAG: hypothetical protein LBD59_05480 [Prevotellaceae bacterium]|jgi:hypothetical protein|nr:hypothetical protein [Prevotellaceae bacterium]
MKIKYIYDVIIATVLYFAVSLIFTPSATIASRIFVGLCMAIGLTISMNLYVKKLRIILYKNTYQDQVVINQGLTNRYRGIIADGGVGYLLHDRFVFHPHKLNFSKKDKTILLSEIEQV